MDEGGGKEANGDTREGGSGDAPELLPLSAADSGISLASKLEEGEASKISGVSSTSSSGKDTASSELDTNDVDSGSQHGCDDVEMNLADTDSPGSPKVKAESSPDMNKRSRPPGDSEEEEKEDEEEEGMSVDPDDVVFTLDRALEVDVSHGVDPGSSLLGPSVSTVTSRVEGEEGCAEVMVDEPSSTVNVDRSSNSDKEEVGVAVAPEDLPDLSTDSDDDTLDSLDEDGAGVVNPDLLTPAQRRVLHRRRLKNRLLGRRHHLSISSDSDDNDDITDDDQRDSGKSPSKDSDNEDEIRQVVQEAMDKTMPPPNWFALQELRRREYHSGCRLSSAWFRSRVQSSLHMVRKLMIQERMQGHDGCVNALSFNRIGTLLASGSDDLNIVLWNWQRARPSVTYDSGHRSNVFQAKFMPFSGDCHVISCARDGQVRLAELNSSGVCKATRKLAQHRGAAHKLALELDSPHIFLSCGEDALTYLFDLREEKPHRLVTARENEKKVPLYSIHSNPSDSDEFCVGGRDNYIRVFDKRKISEQEDGGVLKKLCPDHLVSSDLKAKVTCACYNYSGTEILATYNDEDIYLFDNTMSDGANYIHKYTGHRNSATVKGVNFYGPKSEYIVSGSDCGNVYFWDKHTEAIINFQEGDDTGVINALEPHPTLPILATSGLDYDVKLWLPLQKEPDINKDLLKKTMKKNLVARSMERVTSEPEIGGQMLWFIMHHYRNSARRRMREEGQVLSSSDDDDDSHSDDSENNHMQCAQS